MDRLPPEFIVHSRQPLNAEPRLPVLRAAFVTPPAQFYILSHGDSPALDITRHRLHVVGLVRAPLDPSMSDLRARFAPRSIAAVLQCAGNRRAELQACSRCLARP